MKLLKTKIVCVMLGLAAALPASAAIINLSATLDGAQASAGAGTGSAATGIATMTLDDSNYLFSWNVAWSNLEGNLTVAHFHGPAGPNANAGVTVDFLSIAPGNPSIGSDTLSAGQASDLLNGLWYINIHSDKNPGGEIRGQVSKVDEPAILALLGMSFFAMLLVRRRTAKQLG